MKTKFTQRFDEARKVEVVVEAPAAGLSTARGSIALIVPGSEESQQTLFSPAGIKVLIDVVAAEVAEAYGVPKDRVSPGVGELVKCVVRTRRGNEFPLVPVLSLGQSTFVGVVDHAATHQAVLMSCALTLSVLEKLVQALAETTTSAGGRIVAPTIYTGEGLVPVGHEPAIVPVQGATAPIITDMEG
jgi:hypothetical protein